jgi:hypothetical protein
MLEYIEIHLLFHSKVVLKTRSVISITKIIVILTGEQVKTRRIRSSLFSLFIDVT